MHANEGGELSTTTEERIEEEEEGKESGEEEGDEGSEGGVSERGGQRMEI
jgi:hypothetical protein